ncbi:hypothetical protein TNCV_2936781 [Trichonephila clavipes]|nr:hypothetical protein TNCV_2936781 [Trichonephila clavipes]
MVGLKNPARMKTSTSPRVSTESTALLTRTLFSSTMVHLHIFRLRCETTFLLHILGGRLDTADLILGLYAPHISIPDLEFFFGGHLKSFVYKIPVATVEDLIARIIVSSAVIASTLYLFGCVRQSFVRLTMILCYDFQQFL